MHVAPRLEPPATPANAAQESLRLRDGDHRGAGWGGGMQGRQGCGALWRQQEPGAEGRGPLSGCGAGRFTLARGCQQSGDGGRVLLMR